MEKTILHIELPDDYKSLLDRLLLAANTHEYTVDLLDASEELLTMNPSNHIIWNMRKTLIKYFNYSFDEERALLDRLFVDEIKNYQLWNHRKWLLIQSKNDTNEKEFLANIMSQDMKNIHAWTYRLYCVKNFKWSESEEIAFANNCIDGDVMNNSAWSYRANFVSIDANELEYTVKKVREQPLNESSWNWLSHILEEHQDLIDNREVKDILKTYVDPSSDDFCIFGAILYFNLLDMGFKLEYDSARILTKAIEKDRKRASFYEFLSEKYTNQA